MSSLDRVGFGATVAHLKSQLRAVYPGQVLGQSKGVINSWTVKPSEETRARCRPELHLDSLGFMGSVHLFDYIYARCSVFLLGVFPGQVLGQSTRGIDSGKIDPRPGKPGQVPCLSWPVYPGQVLAPADPIFSGLAEHICRFSRYCLT